MKNLLVEKEMQIEEEKKINSKKDLLIKQYSDSSAINQNLNSRFSVI